MVYASMNTVPCPVGPPGAAARGRGHSSVGVPEMAGACGRRAGRYCRTQKGSIWYGIPGDPLLMEALNNDGRDMGERRSTRLYAPGTRRAVGVPTIKY